MSKWRVYGTVRIEVCMTVDADNKEEAIEAAYSEFPGLTNYAGNGGIDQIVGVNDRAVSLDSGGYEPEFDDAEPD